MLCRAQQVTLPVALALLPVLTTVIAIVVRSSRGFAPGPAPVPATPAPDVSVT